MAYDWNNSFSGTGAVATPGLPMPQSTVPPAAVPLGSGNGYGGSMTTVGGAPAFGIGGVSSPFSTQFTGYLPSPFAPTIGGFGYAPYAATPGFGTYGSVPYAGAPGLGTAPFAGRSTLGFSAVGLQMGEQLTDSEIESVINDALDLEPVTSNADIQVTCQDHVVTLIGTSVNRIAKIVAGTIAWSVPGVRDVENTIQIKSRSQQGQKQRQPVGAGR